MATQPTKLTRGRPGLLLPLYVMTVQPPVNNCILTPAAPPLAIGNHCLELGKHQVGNSREKSEARRCRANKLQIRADTGGFLHFGNTLVEAKSDSKLFPPLTEVEL